MDNDLTLNQDLDKLSQQLSETITARGGLEDDFGRLLVGLFAKHITRLTRDVTGDKYRKDLTGYNNALSDLHAYQRILKELQLIAHPLREAKLREKLDETRGE